MTWNSKSYLEETQQPPRLVKTNPPEHHWLSHMTLWNAKTRPRSSHLC